MGGWDTLGIFSRKLALLHLRGPSINRIEDRGFLSRELLVNVVWAKLLRLQVLGPSGIHIQAAIYVTDPRTPHPQIRPTKRTMETQ